jgi:hypothetical protein
MHPSKLFVISIEKKSYIDISLAPLRYISPMKTRVSDYLNNIDIYIDKLLNILHTNNTTIEKQFLELFLNDLILYGSHFIVDETTFDVLYKDLILDEEFIKKITLVQVDIALMVQEYVKIRKGKKSNETFLNFQKRFFKESINVITSIFFSSSALELIDKKNNKNFYIARIYYSKDSIYFQFKDDKPENIEQDIFDYVNGNTSYFKNSIRKIELKKETREVALKELENCFIIDNVNI